MIYCSMTGGSIVRCQDNSLGARQLDSSDRGGGAEELLKLQELLFEEVVRAVCKKNCEQERQCDESDGVENGAVILPIVFNTDLAEGIDDQDMIEVKPVCVHA